MEFEAAKNSASRLLSSILLIVLALISSCFMIGSCHAKSSVINIEEFASSTTPLKNRHNRGNRDNQSFRVSSSYISIHTVFHPSNLFKESRIMIEPIV